MIQITIRETNVPALGLGTWRLWGNDCVGAVEDALAIGYRHIDTAQMYDNEKEVGEGIRRSGVAREDIFVVTKLWSSNLAPRDVRRSMEKSLKDLRAEYVDLLLIHWPNERVPLEHTLDAMLELQEEGKTRFIGVSNFPPELFQKALDHASVACNQVEYHPFMSQARLAKMARENDAMLTAYSPLAKGRVIGNGILREIAAAHGKNTAQVVLRWLVQQDNVSAIPKASSGEHRRSNFDIFDFELSSEEMDRIFALAGDDR